MSLPMMDQSRKLKIINKFNNLNERKLSQLTLRPNPIEREIKFLKADVEQKRKRMAGH